VGGEEEGRGGEGGEKGGAEGKWKERRTVGEGEERRRKRGDNEGGREEGKRGGGEGLGEKQRGWCSTLSVGASMGGSQKRKKMKVSGICNLGKRQARVILLKKGKDTKNIVVVV